MMRDYLRSLIFVLCCFTPIFGNQISVQQCTDIDECADYDEFSEPMFPTDLIPNSYNLVFRPNIVESTFSGKVKINITCLEPTNVIVLHAHSNLKIANSEVKVTQFGLNESSTTPKLLAIERSGFNPQYPHFEIYLKEKLNRGAQFEIELTFSADKPETENGLIKVTYPTDGKGDQHFIATSMVQNHARRFFPCFDEPAYKVPFDVSIARPKTMKTLFNTELRETTNIDDDVNYVLDHFEQTPPMSTFSLGFITYDFKQLNEIGSIQDDKKSPMVRIWSRPQIQEKLAGTYEKVHAALKSLQNFWAADFPLHKLDIVVLPKSSSLLSSENWGLIFLEESEISGTGFDRLIEGIAYQWLGFWATPSSWSETRLTRSFAEFLSAYTALENDITSDFSQEWPLTFLYSRYYWYGEPFPSYDGMPKWQKNILSSKQTLVIRMLNYTMGPQSFKKGLQNFFANHQFKTFSSDDIGNSMTKQAHLDKVLSERYTINDIAKSWNLRDEFPVVTVTRNYNEQTAIVTQKIFLREHHDVLDKDKNLFWIPLVLVDQNSLDFTNSTPAIWMEEKREVTLTNLPASDKFIIVNPEEIGPFPVNYDKENWKLVANYLKTKEGRNKIPVLTRAKLIHDAWNLAYTGDLDFATAFNMLSFIKDEHDPIVWERMFPFFEYVGRQISGSLEIHNKFKKYIITLLKPLYEELGSEDEENEESWKNSLRLSTKYTLLNVGYEPLIREAQTAFKKWMDQENPDEGMPVADRYLCPVFKHGTQEEWDFTLARVKNFLTSSKIESRLYLFKTFIGCPNDKQKIEKLLNITILEEKGNYTEDIHFIFTTLTRNSIGYTYLFDFLSDNWDVIKSKFSSKPDLWEHIIEASVESFKTQEGYDKVLALYNKHKGEFGSAEDKIEELLKIIKEETKWSNVNLPIIESWLDDYLKMVN